MEGYTCPEESHVLPWVLLANQWDILLRQKSGSLSLSLYIYIYIYIYRYVISWRSSNAKICSWYCCIITMISITSSNTNTGGLFRFRYERVYQFLALVHGDTRRETQFLKTYANHTMLTQPQHTAHLVMFKISNNLCWLRSEKLNHAPQWSNPQFSGPTLLGMKSSTFQPHFLSAGLLWQMVIVTSFLHERKTAANDYAPGDKRPEWFKASPNWMKNIINKKWLI